MNIDIWYVIINVIWCCQIEKKFGIFLINVNMNDRVLFNLLFNKYKKGQFL